MNYQYNIYIILTMSVLLYMFSVFQYVSATEGCTLCVFSMSLHLGDEVFDMYSMCFQYVSPPGG